MDLTELCQTVFSNTVEDKDAVALLVEAMKTSGKVYKNCKIYGGKDQQTDRMVQTAINYSLKPFDKGHVIWKGMYGEKGKLVTYWFFMVGILVIRGIDGYWCLVGPRISRKQWQTWAKENA